MTYQLNTPWNNETWVDNTFTPYARLAGKPIAGGTPNGVIAPRLTDIARGITLLVNGSVVTENRTPSQDDLSDADAYYLGGHEYTISDSEAAILIAAGYSDYLTPVV